MEILKKNWCLCCSLILLKFLFADIKLVTMILSILYNYFFIIYLNKNILKNKNKLIPYYLHLSPLIAIFCLCLYVIIFSIYIGLHNKFLNLFIQYEIFL